MRVNFVFYTVESFYFHLLSACFLYSTFTNRLPLLIFFTGRRFTLSIKKVDNLTKEVSSRDSLTINIGNSIIPLSESDSETFLFFFQIFICYMHLFFHWSYTSPTTTVSIFCSGGDSHSLWLRRGHIALYTRFRKGISSPY